MFVNNLKTSGAALLTGLALLVIQPNSAIASPNFDFKPSTPLSIPFSEDLINRIRAYEYPREFYRKSMRFARESLIISYEEWADFRQYKEFLKTSRSTEPIKPHPVEIKALLMIRNPKLVSSILTKKEIDDYELEIKMFDPYEDVTAINIKYGLNLSINEFQNNIGAMYL